MECQAVLQRAEKVKLAKLTKDRKAKEMLMSKYQKECDRAKNEVRKLKEQLQTRAHSTVRNCADLDFCVTHGVMKG